MKRRDFVRVCGGACFSGAVLPVLLQGCASVRTLKGNIVGPDLLVPLDDSKRGGGGDEAFTSCIVVENDQLQYPVCVYRFSGDEYTALWMRCTHQGTELQVFGDTLQCPAHGSEFSNRGEVQNGPATEPLRTFPVTKEGNQLKVSLR